MLRPLHQFLVLETIEPEIKREAGERIPAGIVVAISEQIKDIPLESKVIYARNSGEYVNYKSKVYLIIRYQDVLAVLGE